MNVKLVAVFALVSLPVIASESAVAGMPDEQRAEFPVARMHYDPAVQAVCWRDEPSRRQLRKCVSIDSLQSLADGSPTTERSCLLQAALKSSRQISSDAGIWVPLGVASPGSTGENAVASGGPMGTRFNVHYERCLRSGESAAAADVAPGQTATRRARPPR